MMIFRVGEVVTSGLKIRMSAGRENFYLVVFDLRTTPARVLIILL